MLGTNTVLSHPVVLRWDRSSAVGKWKPLGWLEFAISRRLTAAMGSTIRVDSTASAFAEDEAGCVTTGKADHLSKPASPAKISLRRCIVRRSEPDEFSE